MMQQQQPMAQQPMAQQQPMATQQQAAPAEAAPAMAIDFPEAIQKQIAANGVPADAYSWTDEVGGLARVASS
jgi:hypothetical protein